MSMAGTMKSSRMDTGVSGLNYILSGVLPPGQIYLLEGIPGTSKTTLALKFIRIAIMAEEQALFITLSESKRELEALACFHGGPQRC